MTELTLVIGNKNYSSWSMRPWVLLKQSGIAFEEIKVRFDSLGKSASFNRRRLESLGIFSNLRVRCRSLRAPFVAGGCRAKGDRPFHQR